MKNGKPVAMSYETPESSKYKRAFTKYVQEEAEKQGWDMAPTKTQHFYVDTWFYFPRTDMDANNYFKVMLDAITDSKCIWMDDNVVCERVQAICYDSASPRVELLIHPVDYIGIFKNLPQYESFVSDCIGCTRYKRNCNILRNAVDGRVQDEVVNGRCSKCRSVKHVDKR